MKKILVTGTAGFIGFHAAQWFAAHGYEVTGIDNINDYYDTGLKFGRLEATGISRDAALSGQPARSTTIPGYTFIKGDITDKSFVDRLFGDEKFSVVCHLAAQAGVRYSLKNPYEYINSNVLGMLNILEACRNNPVDHLLYASSSSVYGDSEKVPFTEDDRTDCPVSLYAATKKADEVMAYAYSRLYSIPATGLRFFTVYGPWGRPDMAPFIFMKAILATEPINVFNNGDMYRDFTYVDDIVEGIGRLAAHPPVSKVPHTVFNIGNGDPVKLMDFIGAIERAAERKAEIVMRPMQPGDVPRTYADTSKLQSATAFTPRTPIQDGIRHFYQWYIQNYTE